LISQRDPKIWLSKVYTYYNGKSILTQSTHIVLTRTSPNTNGFLLSPIFTYPEIIIQIGQTVFEILPIMCSSVYIYM
jgi:hypothetical protein